MRRICVFVICVFVGSALLACAAEKIEILRDEFGVPHIFAKTAPGAAYASGYVQAADRLEELMRNLRKSQGTMAEAFGAKEDGNDWYRHDYLQRMFAHTRVAKEHYGDLPPHIRAIIEAYCAGINGYTAEHPKELPPWGFKVEPWMIVGLSRYTIWSWHQADAAGDLKRGGIEPDPIPYLGSNEMLIAPGRTASHAVIAVIDPHLSWYGETRYYEMRVYGGEMAWSGGTRVGLPFPVLGHGYNTSIAMTTGGPDTGDVFVEEVANGKYKFRGEWRPLTVVHERINVKDAAPRDVAIEYTHHGPIWAHKDGKAYSMSTPYHSEFRLIEAAWAMTTAKNLAEMKRALAMRQHMAQNIMVGTADGDIYYIRTGRVPVRPQGCDPSMPMPGTGECEYEGLHEIDDLVQITNPEQGYMQNCNISPFVMMKNSPLIPERWNVHPYLYNDGRTPPHQRAAMTLDQLASAERVTFDDAVKIAFSTEVYKAATWQARIAKAMPQSEFARMLTGWNRRTDADSRPALAFYLFKMSLGDAAKEIEPPASLSDDRIRAALRKAEERLFAEFSPDATYGTYFRVGRQGAPRNYSVGGGSLREAGMAVPRAINFEKHGSVMVGVGGQTSTQIVELRRPVPKSVMIIPLGESDHPDSPHFDDQAQKLFSKGIAKPTYFGDRKELEKHVTERKELIF
jgi:acyl-homoserine-lactone acylase